MNDNPRAEGCVAESVRDRAHGDGTAIRAHHLQPGLVRIAADGTEASAQARPITDPDAVKDIFESFRGKYGADVDRYYPKRDVAVELPLA